MPQFYVYVMSDDAKSDLVSGVTSTIHAHVWQHKNGNMTDSKTVVKSLDRLVHLEQFANPADAVDREQELRGWNDDRQRALVMAENPEWVDLSDGWFDKASCE